jgi:hypothetical protein
MENDPNNEPEMQKLNTTLANLDNVDSNHTKVENEQYNSATAGKVANALTRGETSAVTEMLGDEKAELVIAGATLAEAAKLDVDGIELNRLGVIGMERFNVSNPDALKYTAPQLDSTNEARQLFAKLDFKMDPKLLRDAEFSAPAPSRAM